MNSRVLCECGCGELTAIPNKPCNQSRYVMGHHARRPLRQRFMAHLRLARDLSPNGMKGCLLWVGAGGGSYGRVNVAGRLLSAHRVAWHLSGRTIPEGLQLDHLCRRPACVNPAHLEPVTGAENTRRGRGTKLTAADVATIRSRVAAGETQVAVAAEFGISSAYTCMLVNRKWWVAP